ncbi:MAG: hypothetical protein ACRDAW_00825, partial [Metamycoplasmataceae bacterium]
TPNYQQVCNADQNLGEGDLLWSFGRVQVMALPFLCSELIVVQSMFLNVVYSQSAAWIKHFQLNFFLNIFFRSIESCPTASVKQNLEHKIPTNSTMESSSISH